MAEQKARNARVAIIGHVDHGKSALAAAVLRALAIAPDAPDIATARAGPSRSSTPKRRAPASGKRALE